MIITNSDHKFTHSGIAVFHQKPQRRTIFFQEFDKEEFLSIDVAIKPYFVSLPDVFFSIYYQKEDDEYYISGAPKMVFSDSDSLEQTYIPPFPNIFEDFGICCEYDGMYCKTLQELCEQIVSVIWSSPFDWDGFDDRESGEYSIYQTLGNPKRWQTRTKRDPKWIPNKSVMIKTRTHDSKSNFGFVFDINQFFGNKK